MTTFSGTIKSGGSAIAASYFPTEWTMVSVEYALAGNSWSVAATAAVLSDATFSIDSADDADREVRLLACQPVGRPWASGLSVSAGDYVHKSTGLDGVVFRAGGAGTTGGSEPTWDATHGNTTSDNGITWTAVEYLSMSDNQGPHIHLDYAAGIPFSTLIINDSPTAYWRLGESSGTVAADEAGTYDGTYRNSPTLGAAGLLANDPDTAVSFDDASSQWVDFGDVLDPGANDFSVMTVCKLNETADLRIIQKRGTGSYGDQAGWALGHLSFNGWQNSFIDAGDGSYASFSEAAFDALFDGQSHIVHLTWDNSAEEFKGYIDGAFVETATVSGSLAGKSITNARGLSIACSENGGAQSQFLDGVVDDCAIFVGTVLTAEQIAEHASKAGFGQ